jgi:hypothetical protein
MEAKGVEFFDIDDIAPVDDAPWEYNNKGHVVVPLTAVLSIGMIPDSDKLGTAFQRDGDVFVVFFQECKDRAHRQVFQSCLALHDASVLKFAEDWRQLHLFLIERYKSNIYDEMLGFVRQLYRPYADMSTLNEQLGDAIFIFDSVQNDFVRNDKRARAAATSGTNDRGKRTKFGRHSVHNG